MKNNSWVQYIASTGENCTNLQCEIIIFVLVCEFIYTLYCMCISHWDSNWSDFFYLFSLFYRLHALKHPWKIKCSSKSSTAMWPNTRKFHAVTFISNGKNTFVSFFCTVSASFFPLLLFFITFFFIMSFALSSLVWLLVCREWNDYMPLSFILSLSSLFQWQLYHTNEPNKKPCRNIYHIQLCER